MCDVFRLLPFGDAARLGGVRLRVVEASKISSTHLCLQTSKAFTATPRGTFIKNKTQAERALGGIQRGHLVGYKGEVFAVTLSTRQPCIVYGDACEKTRRLLDYEVC